MKNQNTDNPATVPSGLQQITLLLVVKDLRSIQRWILVPPSEYTLDRRFIVIQTTYQLKEERNLHYIQSSIIINI